MDTLVEDIAKALWEREYTESWDAAPDRAKIDFRDHARLAVAKTAGAVQAWGRTRGCVSPVEVADELERVARQIDPDRYSEKVAASG